MGEPVEQPRTRAGRDLLADRWLLMDPYGEAQEAMQRAILAIEAEAADLERKRIHDAVHVSLSASPMWAHVDSYGLGQVLKGKPWPEDR